MNKNYRLMTGIVILALLFSAIGGYAGSKIYDLRHPSTAIKTSEHSIQNVNYSTQTSDVKKAIKVAYDAVVEISTSISRTDIFNETYTSDYAGSGVIVSSDGYIVTNNHVVVNEKAKLTVKLSNGKSYEAKIIGTDPKTDLALLKIEAKDLTFAKFSDSDKAEIGDNVIVIGNPLGKGTSVTTGIISVKDKMVTVGDEVQDLIQTNAAVNQGNSGGGLFNIGGELIGIINSKSSGNGIEGMGYAIPSNVTVSVIDELKQYGYVKSRATLGITTTNIQNNPRYEDGLYIVSVIENTAADKAGLKRGDLLKKINDTEIKSYSELSYELKKYKIGDNIKITIIRDQKEKVFDIKLEENHQTKQ